MNVLGFGWAKMSLLGSAALMGIALVGRPTYAQQQPATTPAPTIRNAQVLPADTPRERLGAIMQGWSRALGVGCDFCHAPSAGGGGLDFPSDANPHKMIARQMVRMMGAINRDWMAPAPTGGPPRVTCFTCHRGAAHPLNVPPQAGAAAPPAHTAPPTPSSPH